MTIVALLILGLVAGVLSGMFGIGGGVLIVPVLTLLFGFSLYEATGTSLVAQLPPFPILAVLAYHRAGLLKMSAAVPVTLGLTLGTAFGAGVALGVDQKVLQQFYGAFLLWTGWRFAEPRKVYAAWRAGTLNKATASEAHTEAPFWMLLLVGLVAGLASGMFGIGGGVIIVPALVALLRLDQKLAVGTSLAAQLLPVGIGGAIAYYQAGTIDLGVGAVVAIGLFVGSVGGAKLALGLSSTTVKRLYGLFLIFVGLRFLGVLSLLAATTGN